MERRNVSSGAPYEAAIGFSRATRVDNIVAVSCTAPIGPDGATVRRGDPYAQARRCLEIIVQALAGLGAGPEDVFRTRTYLVRP